MSFKTTMAAAVLAVLVVLASLGASASGAGSDPKKRSAKSVVLGKTTTYPEPGCPAPDKCEVIARVTGIQMQAGGTDHPFRSPTRGNVVSWWLKLPKLRAAQARAFSQLFGGRPAARLSILRRGKRGRFRLVRQSPVQQLTDLLGKKGRARIRLEEPLFVKAGDYVGVTAITWLPAFAVGLDPAGNSWLASRSKSRCKTPSTRDPTKFAAYYKRTDAHATTSTVKNYLCTYRTARILYWARIVPEPAPQRQRSTATPAPG